MAKVQGPKSASKVDVKGSGDGKKRSQSSRQFGDLSIGSPEEYARETVSQAQMLAILCPNRQLARDALETIKIAVVELLKACNGAGENTPTFQSIDSLGRLKEWIAYNGPAPNQEADLRTLVEIVDRRARRVVNSPRSIQVEDEPLRRDIESTFGATFATLTADDCREALARLLRPNRRRGQLTAAGVAAEIILKVGAWGFCEKEELSKAINRALQRGRRAA